MLWKMHESVVGFHFDGDNYDPLKYACEMCRQKS